jgi:hypothetical protein
MTIFIRPERLLDKLSLILKPNTEYSITEVELIQFASMDQSLRINAREKISISAEIYLLRLYKCTVVKVEDDFADAFSEIIFCSCHSGGTIGPVKPAQKGIEDPHTYFFPSFNAALAINTSCFALKLYS